MGRPPASNSLEEARREFKKRAWAFGAVMAGLVAVLVVVFVVFPDQGSGEYHRDRLPDTPIEWLVLGGIFVFVVAEELWRRRRGKSDK